MSVFRPSTYAEACERARARSAEFGCTVYVFACLERGSGDKEPTIAGYAVDDWFDSSVVAQFDSGRRVDRY
jgi:hypothetical protein